MKINGISLYSSRAGKEEDNGGKIYTPFFTPTFTISKVEF